MRLIALGDCCGDRYVDDGLFYPGGQAVNVAVNAKRDGAEASAFLGIFGDDYMAEHIQSVLAQEDVDCERCRIAHGRTPSAGVRIVQGDRVFTGGKRDSVAHLFRMRIVREDLELLSKFDVCHTTNDAGVDTELAEIHAVVPLSYDFSTGHDDAYLQQICPNIDIAFFSDAELDDEGVDKLIARAHELGTGIVVVTKGSQGSVCSDHGKRYEQGIVPVHAIDAMGAGDSFAAAFLVRYFETRDIPCAMTFAADRAAHTCTFNGAFGHPGKIR